MRFEAFPLGATYGVGVDYTSGDLYAEFVAFQPLGGGWNFGGVAEIVGSNEARGSGQELNLNNINLRYIFDVNEASIVVLRYADYGGDVNLGVNGFLNSVNDLSDLNGAVIGGVAVIVTRQDITPPFPDHYGTVTLAGPIERFGIGGQEFWIDDVCAVFAY